MATLADFDAARRGVSLGPAGRDFARVAMALAATDRDNATDHAAARWGDRAGAITRAAVAAGGTFSGTWASNFTVFDGAAAEFFSSVAQATIVGRLGLRKVPFRTHLLGVISGAVADWVGEGQAKPLSQVVFYNTSLASTKVTASVVITKELATSTDPSAEVAIAADLRRAVVEQLDFSFIDPANTGVPDVQPASITNGITPISATASPTDDLAALIDDFVGDLAVAMFVISPDLAAALNSVERPNIGVRGGTLLGAPVVTSRLVPTGLVALIDPTAIALAEGPAELRSSGVATMQMTDTPTMASAGLGSPQTPVAVSTVSMFQTGCVAIMAERFVNWVAMRPGAVSLITGAAW